MRIEVLVAIGFGLCLPACRAAFSSEDPDPSNGTRRAAPSASAVAAPSASTRRQERATDVYAAVRCGECHEKMYDEWRDSPHAGSIGSPAYQALAAAQSAAECERCHAPMRAFAARPDPIWREGVGCETCHRIEGVKIASATASFELRSEHDIKFGPLCDANEAYFHSTACKPVFTRSELCGACHLLYVKSPSSGAMLPVHTEYDDWQKGPFAAKRQCQSCHMPYSFAAVAVGEPPRKKVPDHGFLGDAGALRGSGIDAWAQAQRKAELIRVLVSLNNARAGHALPAGAPGSQLVVRVTTAAADGRVIETREHAFERRLVDEQGEVAPFYAASRVDLDTRIPPQQTRRLEMELTGADVAVLEVDLLRRKTSPELAKRIGVPADARRVLGATLSIDGSQRLARKKLKP